MKIHGAYTSSENNVWLTTYSSPMLWLTHSTGIQICKFIICILKDGVLGAKPYTMHSTSSRKAPFTFPTLFLCWSALMFSPGHSRTPHFWGHYFVSIKDLNIIELITKFKLAGTDPGVGQIWLFEQKKTMLPLAPCMWSLDDLNQNRALTFHYKNLEKLLNIWKNSH